MWLLTCIHLSKKIDHHYQSSALQINRKVAGMIRLFEGKSSSAYMKHFIRVKFMLNFSDAFLMLVISTLYEYISKIKYNHLNWAYEKSFEGKFYLINVKPYSLFKIYKIWCVMYVITIQNRWRILRHFIWSCILETFNELHYFSLPF